MLNPKVLNLAQSIIKKHPKKMLMIDDVIEAARPLSSPFHNYFTWDKDKALNKLHRIEARDLIVDIEMVSDSPREKTQVYFSLDSDRKSGGGYRYVPDILGSKRLTQELLKTALRELSTIQARYDRIKQLSGVWEAVEGANRKINKRR